MSTYAPLPGCGLGCLPSSPPARRTPLVRVVGRGLAVFALVLSMVAVAVGLTLLPAAGRERLVRGWFRALLRACGVRVRVVGGARLSSPEPGRGTLVVANHVSWLDIVTLLALEPVRVLAKSDVRAWPILGAAAARAGTIFIDRNRLRQLPATVGEIASALRTGQSVLVFPEGSTRCGRETGHFYPAAFQAALDADAPVRPVRLRYLGAGGAPTTAAAFLGEDSLASSMWRVLAAPSLVIEVTIGPIVTGPSVTGPSVAGPSGGRRDGRGGFGAGFVARPVRGETARQALARRANREVVP